MANRLFLIFIAFFLLGGSSAWAHPDAILLSDTLKLDWRPSGWSVRILDPKDSSVNKLRTGDTVRTIDGKNAAALGPLVVLADFTGASGAPIHLVVRRNGKDVQLSLGEENKTAGTAAGSPRDLYVTKRHFAPNFTLHDVSGKAVRLGAVNKNAWVLLNYWGTWCSSCVLEMPDLKKLVTGTTGKLVVLGITVGDKEDKVRLFLEKTPLPYTVLLGPSWRDNDGPLRWYGVSNPGGYIAPVSVLIRPGGEIAYVQLGGSEHPPLLSDGVLASMKSAH